MKKSSVIITALATTVIVGSGILMTQKPDLFTGWTKSKKKRELSVQEKQLAYLKEHEDEIKDFVKSQNPKIESVQIDWDQTQWGDIGNGTPWGGGKVVNVYGGFNNIKGSNWGLAISIEKNGKVNLDNMFLISSLRMGGELFE